MSVLPRSAVQNSTAMQALASVRTRFRSATENARATAVLNRLHSTDENEPVDGLSRDPGVTGSEPTAPKQPADSDGTATPTGSARSIESSVIYRLIQRGQGFVTTSWLYDWLTAEPEPEVIVIDLRETRIVGLVLTILDRIFTQAERELLPALPTATVTRGGYWLRSRIVDRPLRVASIGLAIVVNLGLLSILTGSDDPVTPVTLLLLAALLLAARGFQSTMSLDELTSTPQYQRTTALLIAAFEPPDPPASATSDQDTEATAQPDTETTSDTTESDTERV